MDFLRAAGRLRPPPSPAPRRYEERVDDFIAAQAQGRWESGVTRRSGRWQVGRFLVFLERVGITLDGVEAYHVDAYFRHMALRWSRASLATSGKILRLWFAHCEHRGWVRPCLAAAILVPRIYRQEALPVATQRPSVNVITGLIKANLPARVSFRVASKVDSRTILDSNGSETLLGNGDMLFHPPTSSELVRVHGAFISEEEITSIVEHLKTQAEPVYDESILASADEPEEANQEEEEHDEFYDSAVQIVAEMGQASTSMVQRKLRIGYNRAARLIERMEREGIVGPADGSRPRKVLIQNHSA